MTPLETAQRISKEFLDPTYRHDKIIEAIHRAIVEATTEETNKRRSLEAQLENIRAGGPVIVCDDKRTILRAWNPIRKEWAEFSGIHIGESGRT